MLLGRIAAQRGAGTRTRPEQGVPVFAGSTTPSPTTPEATVAPEQPEHNANAVPVAPATATASTAELAELSVATTSPVSEESKERKPAQQVASENAARTRATPVPEHGGVHVPASEKSVHDATPARIGGSSREPVREPATEPVTKPLTEPVRPPAPIIAAPGSPSAISEHILRRLRSNALPGLSRSPEDPDSVNDTDEPMDPHTQNVWEFFVMPVAQQIEQRLQENALLPVFIVENPFPRYAQHLRTALANLCPALNTYQLDARITANFQDLIIRMAEQRAFGMILLCTSRNQLPREFLSLVRSDGYLSIPLMSAERLSDYAAQRFPQADLSVINGSWPSAIGPQELLCVNTLKNEKEWLAGLQQLAQQRSQAQSSGASVRLEDLYGVESAKRWAQQLFNDLQLAMKGQIHWKEVDRGALFAGPPGTGKTTLARAIALECGIPFMAVTPVKDWMVGGGLDDCIQLMSATFAAARQQSPSILFIDEIDSVGDRSKFQGHNASWNTAFLNALLNELDGFDDRTQVIVIGATNYADNIDAALRRAGRLDRVIQISRPDVQALKAIYLAKLRPYEHKITPEDLDNCAGLSLGLTGADIEVLVRGARRRARLDHNRAIRGDDLLEEIFSIPPQAERNPLHGPQLARTAYHESGHALVALMVPSLREHLQIASVVADQQGALGFVGIKHAGYNQTRSELLDRLCMALAGRAAEALIFGEEHVSTGAGGYSTQNDLAMARRLAEAIVGVYGFSTQHPNWHTTTPSETEMQQLIAQQYDRAKGLLDAQRSLLVTLSERLQKCHVLDRDALLAIYKEHAA